MNVELRELFSEFIITELYFIIGQNALLMLRGVDKYNFLGIS